MLGEKAHYDRRFRIAASLAAAFLALAAHVQPAAATGPRPLDAGAIDIPYPGTPSWSLETYLLSSGNVIVADSEFDLPGADDAGAVFVYDGATGALISRLTGDEAGQQVGGDITLLSNGNFVINSSSWNVGGNLYGAVTWGSGTTGVTGVVSITNSLVDAGGPGITPLTNGNYVLNNRNKWNSRGYAIWVDGTKSVTGAVTESMGLVGAQDDNEVGRRVIALANGNYLVASPGWDDGAAYDAGAVTWGNGTTGVTGVVSSTNSLVGKTAEDAVGDTVETLPNGNYVVMSSDWDGALENSGAVTWGNGTTGIIGRVSRLNSLFGNSTDDGSGLDFHQLSNGNFVVRWPNWDNEDAVNAGAVTWVNGATGVIGLVSSANSLIGDASGDNLGNSSGSIVELTNGNYVLLVPSWHDDNGVAVGAVTWVSRTRGITGFVDPTNSLVGLQDGDLGTLNVIALSNGNYAIGAPSWNNGSTSDVGAVTWGNGATGSTGEISVTNSRVGSEAYDTVGYRMLALTNGNYVFSSQLNGRLNSLGSGAGAVTWMSGSGVVTGVVTESNSLMGAAYDGMIALGNGNYLVGSANWNNGSINQVGALTWGDGAVGATGTVSVTNSLVGSRALDSIGGYVLPLSDGRHYLAVSNGWHYDLADQGAVTLLDGAQGITGVVDAGNSIVGTGSSQVQTTTTGGYSIQRDSPEAFVWNPTGAPLTGPMSSTAVLMTSELKFDRLYPLSNNDTLISLAPRSSSTTTHALLWLPHDAHVSGSVDSLSGYRANNLVANFDNGWNPQQVLSTTSDGRSTLMTYWMDDRYLRILRRLRANAALSALSTSAGALTPAFVSTTLSYTAANRVASSVTLTPTLSDPAGAYSVTSAAGPCVANTCALVEGWNAVTVSVLAEDWTLQNYVVNVAKLSSNASLSALALSAGALAPAFVSTTMSYTAAVPNAVAAVTLLPAATSDQASFTVTNAAGTCEALGCPLAVGANTLTVTVTAGDGVTTRNYVIVVTREAPTSTSATIPESYLKASNAEGNDFFGGSVAISSDTLVVGAQSEDGSITSTTTSPNNNAASAGAAYVYVRSGAGWQQKQMLKSPLANTTYSNFGYSVAIDGDTIVIGEPDGYNYQGGIPSGSAYVFTRSGDIWTMQATLTATNSDFNDAFGISVGIDGDTIIVGAQNEGGSAASTMAAPNNDAPSAGAVYVFTRSAGVWTQQAYLKAGNAEASDLFGRKIDISGDTIVANAYSESGSVTSTMASPNNDAPGAGAVYVFMRSAGVWTQQAYLKASNIDAGDNFGSSVAADGDTILVGARWESGSTASTMESPNNDATWAGAAYVFTRNGVTWTQQAYLKASNGEPYAFFGTSVALDGDLAAIGAPQVNVNGLVASAGAAYVFARNDITWTQQAYLTASNASTSDGLGNVVALDGTTLVAGASNEDGSVTSTLTSPNDFVPGAGAMYVFQGPGSTKISLTNAALTPAFISSTLSYTAVVPNTTFSATIETSIGWKSVLTVTAATPCTESNGTPASTRHILTTCPLATGPNFITITVSDGAGAVQNYFVTIAREAGAAPTPTPTPGAPTPTPTSTSTPSAPTPTPTSTSTPSGPTPTPAPPSPTPTPVGIYVSPKNGAVTTSTVSIIGPVGSGFTGAKRVSVNGVKAFHVVRNDKKIDFTMKPGVAGATVDVVLVKADDTVITITNAYTFEGPTRASGSVSAGAVLTTASGVTITVPRQAAARPAEPEIAGSLVITYMPVEFPAEPPGDVPLSFFEVSMDVDGVGVSTLTNPATLELPVDPAAVPVGQIARLYEWVAASSWSPVPDQSYDPAAGLVTAPIQHLGNYALMSAPAHQWWFPLVTLE